MSGDTDGMFSGEEVAWEVHQDVSKVADARAAAAAAAAAADSL